MLTAIGQNDMTWYYEITTHLVGNAQVYCARFIHGLRSLCNVRSSINFRTFPCHNVFFCHMPMQDISSSHLVQALHLAEEVHHASEDDEQDTSTGTKSEHLGNETLVQCAEALLLENRTKRRECPVVLGCHAGHLGGVLNSALYHVHRSVKHGTDSATHGTGDQVVADLDRLVTGRVRGKHGADLEDAAEVTGVPEDVAPHGGLETLVEGERTFGLDDLANDVKRAGVLGGLSLVCGDCQYMIASRHSAYNAYPAA
jgi:hypothetical protein